MIQNNAARLSIIAVSALLINLILFTAIEYMVGNQRMRLADTTQFDLANFIRMSEQSREVQSRRDPKAPEKPDTEAQKDIDRLSRASKSGGIGGLYIGMPNIDIDIDVGGGIQLARELTPLVRIPADYPIHAAMKGIEGYVVVRFIVTETGSVADPEIMRSNPPGVFDRAAIRAVLRWKYQPQLANGEPTSVITFTRLRFELEK